MKTKIGLIAIIVSLMIGCSYKEIPQDYFYADVGGFGELRIPLIKRFYMFYYERDNWMVLKGRFILIFEVRHVEVLENIFLFRFYGNRGSQINGEDHLEGWFLVDCKNEITEGYTDYKTFSDTLYARYQITTDTLSWRTPRSYSDEFRKERFMPWFPDSITNNRIRIKKDLLDLLKGI